LLPQSRHQNVVFALAVDAPAIYIPAHQGRRSTGAIHKVHHWMDEIITGNRGRSSVWSVAFVAVALFVIIVLVAGMFGGADVATIPAAG